MWEPADVPALSAAVRVSAEHLAPWMPWARERPTDSEREARIAEWELRRRNGEEVVYGIFSGGAVVGGCGLVRRIAPDGLEIGYWVHVDHLRRGIASAAVALLTESAFELDGITHVEIHHDKANVASAAVPRKLGFTFLGEFPDEPEAPGEIGIECRWRLMRPE